MATVTRNSFGPFGLPWELVHPRANADMIGYIPQFIRADDPRPASEQINDCYGQYGGWRPNPRWQMRDHSIIYPGDPARPLVAYAKHGDEIINFYVGAYVGILKRDGSYEIARID